MQNQTYSEAEFIERLISLDNKKILELGCGTAAITRALATNGVGRQIIATEVDEIQHSKNCRITDLPNVTFIKAAAESIPYDDASFDVVCLFSSLHHIPIESMFNALKEIKRVLKPKSIAYIAEPVFAGDFNEILRQFHNEQWVRHIAYLAIKKSIVDDLFHEISEVYFDSLLVYKNFQEFEQATLKVTHTTHEISPQLYKQVKRQFLHHMKNNKAQFLIPYRVNLLQNK